MPLNENHLGHSLLNTTLLSLRVLQCEIKFVKFELRHVNNVTRQTLTNNTINFLYASDYYSKYDKFLDKMKKYLTELKNYYIEERALKKTLYNLKKFNNICGYNTCGYGCGCGCNLMTPEYFDITQHG